MTATTEPLTLTITRSGSYPEIIDGQLAAIIAKLLEPKWRKAILAAGGKVKIIIDCKDSSIVPSVTIF